MAAIRFGQAHSRFTKQVPFSSLRYMPGRFHFLQDRLYFLVGTDEVGRTFGAHVFFPIHAFLDPNLIRLHDLLDPGRSIGETEDHVF